jgi:tripartite-type tricarboxylate transporter receptor subunit TctC
LFDGRQEGDGMDRQRRLLIATAAFGFPFGAIMRGASAQTWPNRLIKLVVPRAAGSGADIAARLLAEQLAPLWEQAVVVENKPGGDAAVAINTLLAAQDDHMLLYAPASSITAHIFQHDKPAYDIAALMPVARVSTTTMAAEPMSVASAAPIAWAAAAEMVSAMRVS